MRDAGYGIRDAGYGMRDAGYGMRKSEGRCWLRAESRTRSVLVSDDWQLTTERLAARGGRSHMLEAS